MSITLTPAAADRVRRFLVERPAARGLRFGVKRTGCSGWSYVVDLADPPGDGDVAFEHDGLHIFVDPQSLPLVDGTRIDFERRGLNAEFVFHNPNAKAACGCGESFTIEDR